MTDAPGRDPLHIEEVLAGLRDPGTVDPELLAAARLGEDRFRGEILPRTLDPVLDRSSRARPRRPLRLVLVSGATALVVGVLVAVLVDPAGGPDPAEKGASVEDGYLGVRGGPTLDLRVLRDDRVVRWSPGQDLSPGDALRLIPYGLEYRWLIVFAVDSRGRSQVVVPFDGAESIFLDEDGEALPGSLVLDEAPGREALVALFSRDSLTAAKAEPFIALSLEQAVEPETRTLDSGAIVQVIIPIQKEVLH